MGQGKVIWRNNTTLNEIKSLYPILKDCLKTSHWTTKRGFSPAAEVFKQSLSGTATSPARMGTPPFLPRGKGNLFNFIEYFNKGTANEYAEK